ncbi:hypothetical protein EVAR_19032_1 [Eumeta japonica]|uniref:Uncharacterized protein n=1 Tax=Eumeta variegata TaxID=151549 RepID=A0A4C1V739_EUMVA|nr:hypothetical protein EVAR_19032_1 [Eumeta japonica]
MQSPAIVPGEALRRSRGESGHSSEHLPTEMCRLNPIPLSNRYPVTSPKAGNVLVTPLGLRVSMDSGDHVLSRD